MAINYQQTDVVNACQGQTECSGATTTSGASGSFDCANGGTVGSTTASIVTAGSATNVEKISHSIATVGSVTWASGNWVVRFNVTTANSNITWTQTWICRFNSSCVNQATIGSLTGQSVSMGTTGVKSMTISGSAQTPAAGDQIVLAYKFSNGMSTSQTFNYLNNQLIDSPFTAATGPTVDMWHPRSQDPSWPRRGLMLYCERIRRALNPVFARKDNLWLPEAS